MKRMANLFFLIVLFTSCVRLVEASVTVEKALQATPSHSRVLLKSPTQKFARRILSCRVTPV